MDTGYFNLRDAHLAGWPLAPWQWGLEDLPLSTGCRCLCNRTCLFCDLCLSIVPLSWTVPGSPPTAVEGRPRLFVWTTYSYVVEVYASWVLCRVTHTLLASGAAACAAARSLREGGSFTYSRSYIQALGSRRPAELGEGLVDLLLSDRIN